MAETGRAMVREAVAVLEDVGELETVVEELRAAGFAEDENRNADCRFTLNEKGGHTSRLRRPSHQKPRTD